MARRRKNPERPSQRDIEDVVRIISKLGAKSAVRLFADTFYHLAAEIYDTRPYASGVYVATSQKLDRIVKSTPEK